MGLFDLDGFKPVNDAYGHVTGDRVLVEAGCRLQPARRRRIRIDPMAAAEVMPYLDAEPGRFAEAREPRRLTA